MEIETLIKQNTWWTKKEEIENDEDIRKWKSGKNWMPALLEKISLKPFSLNFIFGPRQAGKTTLLKLLVKKLLEEGIEAKRIFYFRCDLLSDYKELDELIRAYLEFRKSEGIDSSFIFLDEITFPKEWYRAVKYHIDLGSFKNDVLVLTGSLSMYLKREVELFPGRRGFGKDYTLLPLSFRDFIRVFSPELKLPILNSLEKEEVFQKVYKLLPYSGQISQLFSQYLKIGGFPLCVKANEVNAGAKEAYWSWLKSDLAKIDRSEEIFKRVAKAILEKTPSAISLNSIAKEFEIGTHKTVSEYLDVMEKLFVAKIAYWIEPFKLVFSFKKNRKVYFMDPFFFHLFSDICLSKLPSESMMVENVVGSHLARKYEIGFWKNRREIDLIVKEGSKLVGFEVKWKEKAKEDYSKFSVGKVKNVFCLTKEEINAEKNILPVHLFLSLLDI